MTELVPAQAARLRAPSWKDPRLVVGALLVIGSVVAGALVVSRADDTLPAYVANHSLVPGETVDADDIRVVRVRLGDRTPGYLTATSELPADRVVLRAVLAGELVPVSAVGRRDQVDVQPVAVPLPAEVAEQLAPGTLVDVWVAARARDAGGESYTRPRQVAAAAQVGRLLKRSGGLGGSSAVSVEVLLTDTLVPVVLDAVANEARVSLVAVPGSEPRTTE